MRLLRQLTIGTLVLSLFATPVFAQNALARAGDILATVFGGIFTAFLTAPQIWMKLTLILILFAVLWAVLGKVGFLEGHRNERVLLAIAIAIAGIAPIPSELMIQLFGALGFMGVLVYAIPVFLLMYLSWSINHKDQSRAKYGITLLIWILALLLYIGPVANNSGITRIAEASGIFSVIALGYIAYYIFRTISPGGEEPEDAAVITERKQKTAEASEAKMKPSAVAFKKAENARLRAFGELNDIRTDLATTVSLVTHLVPPVDQAGSISVANQFKKINKDVVAMENQLSRIKDNKQVMNFLKGSGSETALGRKTGFMKRDASMLDDLFARIAADIGWLADQEAIRRKPVGVPANAITTDVINNYKDRFDDMGEIYGVGGEAETVLTKLQEDFVAR